MYFPWNWEFGSVLSKLWNFMGGGGFEPPNPPRDATEIQYIFCNGDLDGLVKLKRLSGIKKMESNFNVNTKYYKYIIINVFSNTAFHILMDYNIKPAYPIPMITEV
jgi:hypothetical protein